MGRGDTLRAGREKFHEDMMLSRSAPVLETPTDWPNAKQLPRVVARIPVDRLIGCDWGLCKACEGWFNTGDVVYDGGGPVDDPIYICEACYTHDSKVCPKCWPHGLV